jgi:hypothetical protein
MFSSTSHKPVRKPRRAVSYRPALDSLEDRCVPAILATLDSATPQHLLGFDSANPSAIISSVPVNGVLPGETLKAISFRPATGALYALGVGNEYSSGSQRLATGHLYTLDPGTGAVTLVGAATGFTLSYLGQDSMAFDPVRDQIRLIDKIDLGNADNLRLDPTTGAVVARDETVTIFNNLPLIAYDRAVPGATATTLYAVRRRFIGGFPPYYSELMTIGDPNGAPVSPDAGVVNSVGSLGNIYFDLSYLFRGSGSGSGSGDVDLNGFAITPSQAAGAGVAYAVATSHYFFVGRPGGGPAYITQLFTVDLGTGAATLVGNVGTDQPVRSGDISPYIGLAVVPPPFSPGGGGGGTLPANLSPNQRFVSEAFRSLLGRDPEASSLSAFSALLDQGFDRLQFVQAMEHSPEYYYHTVNDLYLSILGRAADPAGLQGGALFLAAGGSQDELKALLYGSPEYYQVSGGSDAGFLALCFGGMTGQSLDDNSRTVLSGLLGAGVSRTALALALLRTPASGLEQARRFFAEFLGRLPGAAEAGLHGGVILGSGPDLDLAFILASDEFFHQA